MKFSLVPHASALAVAALFLLSGIAHADTQGVPALPVLNNTSLSLREALAVALSDNLTLKQSQADADSAAAVARSANAQTKPSLSTTMYGTFGDSSNVLTTSPGVSPQNIFVIAPHGFADQNLMLMAPLFTGGRLKNTEAAARKQGEAAALSVQASRLTMAEAVTENYINAVLQQALVDVSQARLTAEDEQVRVTQEKVNTGRSAPVDLLREQAEEADARQVLLAAQNNAALGLISLKTALGVSLVSQIVLSDTLDSLSESAALPATLGDALRQADKSRPEPAVARQRVEAAQAAVSAARGEYAPQVYGVVMGDATAGRDIGRAGYTVGLTASLPLYDGGQRRADVDAAQARLNRAGVDAQLAYQTVDQDTATAWLTWQTAAAQVQAATAGVTAAQQGYDLANLRYSAGKSVTSERLDALSALVRAQGTLAQARAAFMTAHARLATALGILP